jgi:hypothetical protein
MDSLPSLPSCNFHAGIANDISSSKVAQARLGTVLSSACTFICTNVTYLVFQHLRKHLLGAWQLFFSHM